MRPEDRATARRKLDKRLFSLSEDSDFTSPPRGWLKAIRESLGMTTSQLGKRLGVAQSRAVVIEQAEANGTITLNSLEKAAQAMDCRLVYAIVPRKPLDELVEDRAHQKAKKSLKMTSHTMALEAQELEEEDEAELLKKLTRKFIEKSGSSLWEDE